MKDNLNNCTNYVLFFKKIIQSNDVGSSKLINDETLPQS
jgi:hypothetical protein